MMIVDESDIDTPCTRLDRTGCSGCHLRVTTGKSAKCYRAGRSVRRKVLLRQALGAMPSSPPSVWDAMDRRRRAPTFASLTDALARTYGPQWDGTYRDRLTAESIEKYEARRALLPGRPKARKWDDICKAIGLRRGEGPIERHWNRKSVLFGVLPLREGAAE